jgi:CheY-like chemotaxis protein
MKELKILIIEDDAAIRGIYDSAIRAYNKGNQTLNIHPTYEYDKDKAINILLDASIAFDGAIVDIDLKNSGGQDSSGNEIIKQIKGSLRFPVFVISGTTHNLDPSLNEPTDFFKVIDRDDSDFDFIEEFVSIFNTGITNLLNRNGTVEKLMNEIFWKHLSSSLSIWIKDETRNPEQKEKSLLRYTLLHVQEYLDLNSSGTSEKYHPAEFFITKPVKPNIFTGDILETKKGERCVILTPACDIEKRPSGNRKADKILTLRIIPLSEIDSEYENPKISKNKEGKLKSIINNSTPRFHYVPEAGDFKRGAIDFQDKFTIKDIVLEKRIESGDVTRIATISNPFLKDVIGRYSNYYARQGSPDFDSDEIINSIKSTI